MEPADWAALKTRVVGCQRCEISHTCKQKVFGAGNVHAPLMLVGDAPGDHEDHDGIPFVGKAGQVLRRALEKAKYEPNDVYVTNAVKCRPPANRPPTKEETTNCAVYLMKQVEHVNPKVIVAVGATAAQMLTGKRDAMGSLRGKQLSGMGRTVIVTWHPSYWMRLQDDLVWDQMVKDLRKARTLAVGRSGSEE